MLGPLTSSGVPSAIPADGTEAFVVPVAENFPDSPEFLSPPELNLFPEPSLAEPEGLLRLQSNINLQTQIYKDAQPETSEPGFPEFPSVLSSFPNSYSPQPAPSNFSGRNFWEATVPPSTSPPLPSNEFSEVTKHSQMKRHGPLGYSLGLNTSTIFDDNINLRQSGKKGDIQLNIGPTAKLQMGSDESALHLGATYAGAASWLASSPQERSYDQRAGIDGGWSGARLKTAFRLGMQSTHNSSIDAGQRVGRRVWYTGLGASYAFTEKTNGELTADFSKASFNALQGSREYRAQEFVNYQWTPKLQLGLGATEGILRADAGQRQTYEQALLRIALRPTGKLGVNASIGNEWRHFDSGEPTQTSPVFSAALAWQATGQTALSLEARRRTFASALLLAQNYEATDVSITAREMLSSNLDLALSIGWEEAAYQAAGLGVSANRKDDYWYSRISLDWAIRRNCAVGTFYEFSKNVSTGEQAHPFQRNRIGFAISVSF